MMRAYQLEILHLLCANLTRDRLATLKVPINPPAIQRPRRRKQHQHQQPQAHRDQP